MDLISRQAAIDAIKTWGLIDGLAEGQAIEILADEEKLPSAQPENQVHLCDSCRHVYPECPSGKDNVIFGNGKGNDNICACNKYEPSAEPKIDDENELKFYYVESIDDYWIGQRLDNFYYADWHECLGFVWSKSRYLPWGEHIVDENTLWKEHTYPSEPIEIPFTEWIVGFMKKYSAEPKIIRCKDCKNSEHWYRDRRRCFLWSEDGVSVFDDGFCSYAERRTDG